MVEPLPTLSLWGEQFSPRRAEELTGLALSGRVEPGELAHWGRYKGQPSPYGAASLEVPPDIEQGGRLAWMVDAVGTHLTVFQQLGATVCKLHLDIRYWDQCNLEFSSGELARIAALGVPFTISCWDYSGQNEPTEPGAAPDRPGM